MRFLREGAAHERLCVFIGPQRLVEKAAGMQHPRGRKDCGPLVTSAGFADAKAAGAFLTAQFKRAHSEGKSVRVANHWGWIAEQRLPSEVILRIEDEIQHLVERHGGHAMCVLDARAFSGAHLVEVLNAHADRGRVPVEVA